MSSGTKLTLKSTNKTTWYNITTPNCVYSLDRNKKLKLTEEI